MRVTYITSNTLQSYFKRVEMSKLIKMLFNTRFSKSENDNVYSALAAFLNSD